MPLEPGHPATSLVHGTILDESHATARNTLSHYYTFASGIHSMKYKCHYQLS